MPAPKKWVHVEFDMDASKIIDLLEFCEGKTLRPPSIQRIHHGGEDKQTGGLRPHPTAREFLTAFAMTRSTFTVLDAVEEAAEQQLSLTRPGITSMISVMKGANVFKRISKGTYALAKPVANGKANGTHAIKTYKPASTRKPTGGAGKRRKPEGSTATDQVLAFLREKQNGTDQGVSFADIKAAMGNKHKNFSPAITKLLVWKKIERVAPAMYRAIEVAP